MFNLFITKKSDKPKSLGQLGEEFAQAEYKRRGYQIIAKNEYNTKGKQFGEIDFIAKTGQVINFVEVKTRSGSVDRFGTGAEAVNIYKQQKIFHQ